MFKILSWGKFAHFFFNTTCIYISSKVSDRCRGQPEGSLFNSFYTEVLERLLLSLDCSTLPLIRTLYYWVLSNEVSGTIFKVFSMTIGEHSTHLANEPVTFMCKCVYFVLLFVLFSVSISRISVNLATIVGDDPKAPFSIATAQRCRKWRSTFPWIAPLYPWYVPYNGKY